MKVAKRPELTEAQKTKALKLWSMGYGAPKIAQLIRAYNSPVSAFLKKQNLTRTREEMIALRKKNNLVFKSGNDHEKAQSYPTGNRTTNF